MVVRWRWFRSGPYLCCGKSWFETANVYGSRKVDTVTKTRLVMTADDDMLTKMFEATGGTGDAKVVGGSAYDELVRVK